MGEHGGIYLPEWDHGKKANMSEEKKSPYSKSVTYTFEVNDTGWQILYCDENMCEFEETRKNGQEDCHMHCGAAKVDGKWVLDKRSKKTIEMYDSHESIAMIEAYFNEHGMPQDGV